MRDLKFTGVTGGFWRWLIRHPVMFSVADDMPEVGAMDEDDSVSDVGGNSVVSWGDGAGYVNIRTWNWPGARG